jgi:hypothetical protein
MIDNKEHCYNCDSDGEGLLKRQTLKSVCTRCGAWVVPIGSEVELSALYERTYYLGDEYLNYELGKKVHYINFVRKVKILKHYLTESKEIRLLEIGSATGEFLEAAKACGWQKTLGVEISDFARGESISRGHCVVSPLDPDLDRILLELQPNLIVAWDVWEHLDRPTEILGNYLNYASKDVMVALTTVDSESKNAVNRQENWRQFHPPTHINYPSKRSLRYYFEEKQFKLRRHFYFGYFRPLAEYLAVIFGRNALIKNSRLLFAIPIYINLYDTQMLIAERVP